MSSVIPKEKLTAFQRWELASLEEERAAPAPASAEPDPAMLAKLREEAQQQGHAEGFAQGRKAGEEAGHAAGHAAGLAAGRALAAKEAAALRKLTDSFGQAVAEADEKIADELLGLALDLSRTMLQTALKIRPDLVLPIASEAIRYLPQVQQPALLVLHPEDAKIVRHYLADELEKGGWRVTEDAAMTRGGCRVETATNQIDATIETRWQRLTEAFGRQSDWLE